jgi:hypothetical protein
MRKFIDIVESAAKLYYHGSNDELPVGTILKGRGSDYENDWSHTDFYQILEKYRPANMLSHKDAVFMCKTPEDVDISGGGTEWLFTVEPLGIVQRHDLNWSSEISNLLSVSEFDDEYLDDIIEAAANYWNGVPHHDENVWEYLTPSAKIVKVEEY